jgi:hypothetical protein
VKTECWKSACACERCKVKNKTKTGKKKEKKITGDV